jgi:hypothetical protein
MPTHADILRILSEAEPLFASEIAERLNLQLRPAAAYRTIEVGRVLQGLRKEAAQLADGRWTLIVLHRRWTLDAETIAALTVWWARERRHGNITSSLLPRLQKDGNRTAYVGQQRT